MIPVKLRPGRHLDIPSARLMDTNNCPSCHHYTARHHGSNRIYSFPRVHEVSPLQPCHRPKSTSFRDRSGNDRPQTTTASLWNAPRKLLLPAMGDVPLVLCLSAACPLSLACVPTTTLPTRYRRPGQRMPLGNMTVPGCFASATPRCWRPRRCACHASPPEICTR